MLAYAGLTMWAASSGTSTYTRLLDVEYTKYDQKLADLKSLQPSRMACSFFFGMGIGIFIAFITSMVEMANHKRVRQVLFILLMAVPIIVLGAIGVNGSKNVCEFNPGGQCSVNLCKGTVCEFGDGVSCDDKGNCPPNTCQGGTCSQSGESCKSDQNASLSEGPPNRKRKLHLPKRTNSKFPKISKFWKSLTGTHESDRMHELYGDDTSKTDFGADDVLRYNVMVSDYLFIGLGCGVLIAGIFTILPDNPFHPSKFDIEYQSNEQANFSRVSQVNPTWWVYALILSLIMAGGGTSSLILTHTSVANYNDNQKPPRDVRKDGQLQSLIAVILSVVMFVVILFLGKWHIKRHRKLGELMQNYSTSQSKGITANQLSRRS